MHVLPVDSRRSGPAPRASAGRTRTTVLASVARTATLMWWRKLVTSLGKTLSVALCALLVLGVVAFWVWLLPTLKEQLGPLVSVNADIEAMMFAGVMSSFLLVVVAIRVVMLAFDSVSRDLRRILMVAPLSKGERAILEIIPDVVSNLFLSLAVGFIGVGGYVAVSDRLSWPTALLYGLAVVVVVGAVSRCLEWLLSAVLGSPVAARGGAAVISLAATCAVLLAVVNSLRSAVTPGALAGLADGLLAVPSAWACLGAIVVSAIALAVWLVAAAAGERLLAADRSRPVRVRLREAGATRVAVLSLVRNPSSKLAILSLGLLVALAVWLTDLTGLGAAGLVAVGASIMAIVVTGLGAYGDYLHVRWRVLASPMSRLRPWAAWTAGQLVTGLVVASAMLAVVVAIRPHTLAGWGLAEVFTLVSVGVVSISGGILAGRIVPYDEGDVMSVAMSGLLAVALDVLGLLAVFRLIPDQTSVLRPVLALVVAAAYASAAAYREVKAAPAGTAT